LSGNSETYRAHAKFWAIPETASTATNISMRPADKKPPRRSAAKKPNIKNRIDSELERKIVNLAFEQPAWGQLRVSNHLRKEGVFISPGGVRSVWLRHDLQTFKLRLKALEAKVAQEGVVLTENQLLPSKKPKSKKKPTVR
jgi:hypothetical protein